MFWWFCNFVFLLVVSVDRICHGNETTSSIRIRKSSCTECICSHVLHTVPGIHSTIYTCTLYNVYPAASCKMYKVCFIALLYTDTSLLWPIVFQCSRCVCEKNVIPWLVVSWFCCFTNKCLWFIVELRSWFWNSIKLFLLYLLV